jgi:hypothetical protein
MSHVATVELEVKDLDALAKACEPLGLEFRLNQKTFRWYGRWVNDYSKADAAYKHGIKPEDYGKCLHAIAVKGNDKAYEVGIIQKPDGTFGLVWDFYEGGYGLMELVGKDCGKLAQEYAAQVAMKQARKQGFQVKRTLDASTGKVLLKCVR